MHHIVQIQAACGAFLTFFPLIIFKIFKEDFQGHKIGPASVWLPLCSLFTCQIWVLHSAFFRDSNKSEFIWKAWCVQVWIWREESLAWSPLVCQQADSVSLSRNILAFLQQTPIPILFGSRRNQSSTHLKNIREGTHRLVPYGLYR